MTLNGTKYDTYPKSITITPPNINSTEATMSFTIQAHYTFMAGYVYNPVTLYLDVGYYNDESEPIISNGSADVSWSDGAASLSWTYYDLSCDVTMTMHPGRSYAITLYPALLPMPY